MEHMKYVVIESKCHYGIVVIQASRLLKKKKTPLRGVLELWKGKDGYQYKYSKGCFHGYSCHDVKEI